MLFFREPTELTTRSGLPFEVVLTQDIDISKAAAGNGIRGELASPIQEGRKLIVSNKTKDRAYIVVLWPLFIRIQRTSKAWLGLAGR